MTTPAEPLTAVSATVANPLVLIDTAEDLLAHLAALALAHGPLLALAGGVLLAARTALGWSRRVARRRWYAHARGLTVLAPAGLDGDTAMRGARRAWWELLGLARPRWRRLVAGQPHLALELWVLPGQEPLLRFWIPGTVPPHRVDNALRASWPGCLLLPDEHHHPAATRHHTSSSAGEPLDPAAGAADPMGALATAGTITAGRATLRRPEYVPLRTPQPREDADPLRTLQALAERLEPGERVVLQILARPALGGRLRRYHTRAAQALQGRPARSGLLLSALTASVRAVLELLTPGPGSHPHPTLRQAAHPLLTDEQQAIRDKAGRPLWEVAVRYAAVTQDTGPTAQPRVRGLADAAAGVFAVLTGRNQLRRRPLHRPHRVLPGRQLRHGCLWSIPELAMLAHLPVRTAELAGHTARGIPAPEPVTGTPDP